MENYSSKEVRKTVVYCTIISFETPHKDSINMEKGSGNGWINASAICRVAVELCEVEGWVTSAVSFEGKSRVVFCINHVSQNCSFSARELRWCTSSVIFCYAEAFRKFTEKIIAHNDDPLRKTAVFWEVTPRSVSDCTASQPGKQYSAGTICLAPTFGRREVKRGSVVDAVWLNDNKVVLPSLINSFLPFIHSFFLSFFELNGFKKRT